MDGWMGGWMGYVYIQIPVPSSVIADREPLPAYLSSCTNAKSAYADLT